MGQWTFLELAKRVLEEEKRPLSSLEIWEVAKNKGYDLNVGSLSKTPWVVLGVKIYESIRDKEDSPFVKRDSRPQRFYLRSLEETGVTIDTDYPNRVTKPTYREKDLHPFLAYYASLYLKAYVKTIHHLKSKREFSGWLHPDIVGCYFPIEDWKDSLIEFGAAIAVTSIKLFSFELKRELNFSNLRESFFQTVSNSSWANEGYLVAAEINATDDFLDELKRLSTSFGIGVIQLNLMDPDSSELLFPARSREVLDWDTINKLTINSDFDSFIQRITKDINYKEIRKEQYDPILEKDELVVPGFLSANPSPTITPSKVTFEPSKQNETEETYSYTDVTSFALKGVKYEVKRWRDVLTRVCEVMLEKHRDQFSQVLELKGQKHHWFSMNPNELTFPERIDESAFFVQNHWDANSIVSISRAIIALFGYSKDDLKLDCTKKADFKQRERGSKNSFM